MGFGLFPVLFAQNFSWDDLGETDVVGSVNDESRKEVRVKKIFYAFIITCILMIALAGFDSVI